MRRGAGGCAAGMADPAVTSAAANATNRKHVFMRGSITDGNGHCEAERAVKALAAANALTDVAALPC